MQETILNKLRQEHREMHALLHEIKNAKTSKLRADLFLRWKDEMIPHMEGEELTLHTRFTNDIPSEYVLRLVEENNREHHQMKELIQKLNFLDIESKEWFETFLELEQLCSFHVEHEEGKLFAEAKEDFSPDELERFAYEFEEAKHHHVSS